MIPQSLVVSRNRAASLVDFINSNKLNWSKGNEGASRARELYEKYASSPEATRRVQSL